MKSMFSVASLAAAVAAQSYTAPGAQTYGALNSPSTSNSVTTGQTFTVQWENNAAAGATVSLVLCNGPGANCVLQKNAIASGIPADADSYSWSVPCSLPAGVATTATGYGMLVIVDGTGQFQYSTQFSVNQGSSCSATSSSSSSSSSATSSKLSSSSLTTPSSVSGGPTGAPTSAGWYSWTSTFNTTSTPAYTASSMYTPAAITSGSSSKPSSIASVAASSTSAKPSSYTGAAAMPSAFINAFGLVGAAGLALIAL